MNSSPPNNPNQVIVIVTIIFVCILLFLAILFFKYRHDHQSDPQHNDPYREVYTIGIHGSTTIGEELMPELIRHYLEDKLKLEVTQTSVPPPPGSQNSAYDRNYNFIKDGRSYSINLQCMTSGQGVDDLMKGSCTIAMSSAQNENAEKQKDLRSIMIAGDGLCFVVNNQEKNHVTRLTVEDLQKIYSRGGDWSQYSGSRLQIVPFNHNPGSGTRKTFEQKVHPDEKLPFYSGNQNLEEGQEETLRKVAETPGAIGYVGLSAAKFISQHRTLTLVRIDGMIPTTGSVKSENYSLCRRLMLYAKQNPDDDGFTSEFLKYIEGEPGQAVVASVGFADRLLDYSTDLPTLTSGASRTYRDIRNSAHKLVSNIRFPSNKDDTVDIKGREDILKIAIELKKTIKSVKAVYVFGFADTNKSSTKDDYQLSVKRAQVVAKELRTELKNLFNGSVPFEISSEGCGMSCPVVPNATTDLEFERNRRVEIWVLEKQE